MSKAAVIGAGKVGLALGGSLLKAGWEVKFGSRDPGSAKVQDALSKLPGATAATIAEAVQWADSVLLTTPSSQNTDDHYKAIAESLGAGIKHKVIIDATDPVTDYPEMDWRWEQGTAGGEVLQQYLPDATVYKAFNTVGVGLMPHGDGATIEGWSGGQLSMLYAGGPDKRDVAERIISDIGWRPVYVGPIRYARNLEALAELWIHLYKPPNGIAGTWWGLNFHFQPVGIGGTSRDGENKDSSQLK